LRPVAILEQIADRLGGSVNIHASVSAQHRASTTPDALRRIVEVLDANPLRAKKKHNYEIWRKAAVMRIEGAQTMAALTELRERLMTNPGRVRPKVAA
jgi:hypothetical protein